MDERVRRHRLTDSQSLVQVGVRHQAERLLDHRQEPVGVADQVVGLALGDGPGRARLGGRALARHRRRRSRAHSDELRRDLGQQHPGVLLASAPRGAGWARAASRAAAARSAATWAQA